jgi:Glycosyl hydrolase catalytic core
MWITEYGYQTNPPDRAFGVSYAKQAAYLRQSFDYVRRHRRVDMFLWFLLRDEPRVERWQSGLLTASGRRKPAYAAFARLRLR